jgi:hypothetical protein
MRVTKPKPKPLKVLPPLYPGGPKPAVQMFGDGHYGIVYDATTKGKDSKEHGQS